MGFLTDWTALVCKSTYSNKRAHSSENIKCQTCRVWRTTNTDFTPAWFNFLCRCKLICCSEFVLLLLLISHQTHQESAACNLIVHFHGRRSFSNLISPLWVIFTVVISLIWHLFVLLLAAFCVDVHWAPRPAQEQKYIVLILFKWHKKQLNDWIHFTNTKPYQLFLV